MIFTFAILCVAEITYSMTGKFVECILVMETYKIL